MDIADMEKYGSLYAQIKECQICHGNQPPNVARPFHYAPEFWALTSQTEVMLLTLRPSFQALNRPLVSTRFFRALALSLFGQNPRFTNKITNYFDVFRYGEVYWTHYYKCFREESEIPFKDTPSTCFDIFFRRELDAVSPKLLIILGNPLIQKLFGTGDHQRIPSEYQGVECLCADFPKTGAEPEFVAIRKRLQPLLKRISVDPAEVPEQMGLKLHPYPADSMRKHAEFELECLKKYLIFIKNSASTFTDAKTIDERFCNQEVIPRWNRFNFIVLCRTFIEDQLYTIQFQQNLPAANNNDRNQLEFINLLRNQIIDNDDDLIGAILDLNNIRNAIVHYGGIIPRDNRRRRRLNEAIKRLEISQYNNMIEVDSAGCEKALEIVRRFVATL